MKATRLENTLQAFATIPSFASKVRRCCQHRKRKHRVCEGNHPSLNVHMFTKQPAPWRVYSLFPCKTLNGDLNHSCGG